MAEDVRYKVTLNVAGSQYEIIQDVANDVLERAAPTVSPGAAGTLTARTDANTGVATLDTGHGITTSDVVDVFWSGGKRSGMTATVDGDAVTVDGGSGTDLPATTTVLRVMKPVSVPFTVDGDEASSIVASSSVEGFIRLYDNTGTPVLVATFDVGKSRSVIWQADTGVTNPIAGHITTTARFTHGSSTATAMTMLAVS